MNKFDYINKVLVSGLKQGDKNLLIELIIRADDDWKCWPSVERLCKVRGIKHEKNFKGADYYLPGLVTKVKRGRKNMYYINTPALEGLSEAEVTIKHSTSESNTPSVEGVNTPAAADNTPSVEGANSTLDTTVDNTEPSSNEEGYEYLGSLNLEEFEDFSLTRETLSVDYLANSVGVAAFDSLSNDTTSTDTPAVEGVSDEKPEEAIRRVDYESDYTHDGWLYCSKAAVGRARRTVTVGDDW